MKNGFEKISKFGFILLAFSLISVSICAQDLMFVDPEKYQYDDSILSRYNEQNDIPTPDNYYETLETRIDSVARNVLQLTPKDEISVYSNIIQIKKGNLFGFMDFAGRIKCEPIYEQTFFVKGTNYWLVWQDKWGMINPLSDKVIQIEQKYNSLNTMGSMMYGRGNPNRYIASLGDMYGILDSLANVIIPFEYQSLDTSRENMYLVQKDDLMGFVDSLNTIIIPLQFDECKRFDNNELAPAQKGQWGLINKKGNFVVAPQYDDMFIFQQGILRVQKDGKYGFLNQKGEVLVAPIYDDADGYTRDGVIRVMLDNKYGIINKEGKQLCDTKYDTMGGFAYNCSFVAIGDSLGVINSAGEEIIPLQFEKVQIGEKAIGVYKQGVEKLYFHTEGRIVGEGKF